MTEQWESRYWDELLRKALTDPDPDEPRELWEHRFNDETWASEARYDQAHEAELDWLDWIRMDLPEDALMVQLLDTWASGRQRFDQLDRTVRGDPEELAVVEGI